jgi:hypothetical protein
MSNSNAGILGALAAFLGVLPITLVSFHLFSLTFPITVQVGRVAEPTVASGGSSRTENSIAPDYSAGGGASTYSPTFVPDAGSATTDNSSAPDYSQPIDPGGPPENASTSDYSEPIDPSESAFRADCGAHGGTVYDAAQWPGLQAGQLRCHAGARWSVDASASSANSGATTGVDGVQGECFSGYHQVDDTCIPDEQ